MDIGEEVLGVNIRVLMELERAYVGQLFLQLATLVLFSFDFSVAWACALSWCSCSNLI